MKPVTNIIGAQILPFFPTTALQQQRDASGLEHTCGTGRLSTLVVEGQWERVMTHNLADI